MEALATKILSVLRVLIPFCWEQNNSYILSTPLIQNKRFLKYGSRKSNYCVIVSGPIINVGNQVDTIGI